MLFYMETDERFYFLPYALNGSIDVYGRYTKVTPLPFNGSTEDNKQKPWISGLSREPIYEVQLNEITWGDITKKCVLLSDYSKQISQTVLPRQLLNEPILDVMAECVPMARTALLNSTGVNGMRVGSADEAANVYTANEALKAAALNGQSKIPIIGIQEFQDLSSGEIAKAEEYFQAMQALDNFRLSTYGLENGGLFAKKAHELQTESDMNTRKGSRALQDGLTNRQNFADMANSLFGTSILVEVGESEVGDVNMDGVGYDDNNMDRAEEVGNV